MATRLRHNYRDYDWNRYPALPSSPTSFHDVEPQQSDTLPDELCDLHNDIHPIFQKLNFPGARYEVLKPVLQLATLLLDTDCLLDFWHAIFFGDREVVYDTADHSESHIEYGRRRLHLSAKDRAQTRLKLVALSHMVKFYRDSDLTFLIGECICSKGNVLSNMQEMGLFRRTIDRISYNEDAYQRLCSLHDTAVYLDAEEIDELHLTYLSFAIMLVHEVAHAAVMAEIGDQHWAVFEGSTVAEEGFDWENHVFGGVPQFPSSGEGTNRMTISASWPCASLVNDYLYHGTPIWLRNTYTAKEVETWFDVPQTAVRQLFRSEFWDVMVPRMGAAALRLPVKGGFRWKVDAKGSWTLFRPQDKDAGRFDGIPEGCHVHEADGAFMYAIHDSTGITADGFARLMRINIQGIWGDEEGLKYRLEYPELPKRPPA